MALVQPGERELVAAGTSPSSPTCMPCRTSSRPGSKASSATWSSTPPVSPRSWQDRSGLSIQRRRSAEDAGRFEEQASAAGLLARAARVRAPRIGGRPAPPRTARRPIADDQHGIRPDRTVVPGDEPGDRPAEGGRHTQAGDGRTSEPCVRGARAHRGVHGAGAAAGEPRGRHAPLGACQARPACTLRRAH